MALSVMNAFERRTNKYHPVPLFCLGSAQVVCGIRRGINLPMIAIVIIAILVLSSVAIFKAGNVDRTTEGTRGSILATGNRILNVAAVDMGTPTMTLNPLLAATSAERMVIWPCYSTLLMYAPNGTLVGDLATSWSLSPDGRSWHFYLSHAALFFNKNSSTPTHPVTALDVTYTFWLVENQSGSYLQSYLMNVDSEKVISDMWAPNDFEVYVNTTEPFAPIEEAFSTIPILPEHIWSSHVWNWVNFGDSIGACVGSGPFYYELPGRPTSGFVLLNRSLSWFQEQERGWKIQVDQIRYWDFSSASSAWAELTSEPQQVDIMLKVPRSTYINDLPLTQNITGWNPESGVTYALDVNQMTDALRDSLGGTYASGSNNQLLLNETVKRAIAMCINRTAYVTDSFEGMAAVADSILPDVNPWHFSDPAQVAFDPGAARTMLVEAGWAFDSSGSPVGPATVPLCMPGGTNPLDFRIMTDSDPPEYAEFVNALVASAAQAGILLNPSVTSDMTLVNKLYKGDYDLSFWHYFVSPTSDPTSGVLAAFTTMRIGSFNWNFYTDSEFDQRYNESATTVDSEARRPILDRLQTMLNENLTCRPVAYGLSFYAANNRTWTNYGNWTEQPLLAPDLALPWLYLRIELRNDSPHDLSISSEPITIAAGETVWFNGSAIDDNGDYLTYSWIFGDSNEGNGQRVTHVYSSPGSYVVTLTVTDAFGHESTYQTSIDVGPAIPEFGMMPFVVIVFLVVLVLAGEARRKNAKRP